MKKFAPISEHASVAPLIIYSGENYSILLIFVFRPFIFSDHCFDMFLKTSFQSKLAPRSWWSCTALSHVNAVVNSLWVRVVCVALVFELKHSMEAWRHSVETLDPNMRRGGLSPDHVPMIIF